ncbi:MAG: hypothetical protein HS126_07130 [Anaerolineales bacterium]|nr:hypothetical protein [Anaerolineales bacterium]
MSLPSLPSGIGKRGTITDINGNKRRFSIIDEIIQVQSTNPEKAVYLQQIQFEQDKRIELRLGYYIIGKKSGRAGKWVWGQYATMLPVEDFRKIISKAIEKGWI